MSVGQVGVEKRRRRGTRYGLRRIGTRGAYARWSREQGAVLGNQAFRWVERRAIDRHKVTESVARVEFSCEVGESVSRWPPQTLDSIVRMLRIRNVRIMPCMATSLNPPRLRVIFDPTTMLSPAQTLLDVHIRSLRNSSSPFWRFLASNPRSHLRPKEVALNPASERAHVRYHCSRAPLKDQSPGILICPEGRHLPRELYTLSPPRAKMYPEIEPYQTGRLEVDSHSL